MRPPGSSNSPNKIPSPRWRSLRDKICTPTSRSTASITFWYPWAAAKARAPQIPRRNAPAFEFGDERTISQTHGPATGKAGGACSTLVPVLRRAKERRQVIIVTHNPNVAVASERVVPLEHAYVRVLRKYLGRGEPSREMISVLSHQDYAQRVTVNEG
jgi:hypothetical protein